MNFVFERDADGLLHQVRMTKEEMAATGRNLSMVSIQSAFVFFTAEQEAARAVEVANALAKQQALEAAQEAARVKRAAEVQDAINKAAALEAAKQQAAAQQDSALMLALEQLEALKAKVAAMEAASQSPNS